MKFWVAQDFNKKITITSVIFYKVNDKDYNSELTEELSPPKTDR
jgi:hypothetical protein